MSSTDIGHNPHNRAEALTKARSLMLEDFERQKKNLINETEKARPSSHRFVNPSDSVEDSLKNSTVGLVHLEEFQQKRKELEEQRAREAARSDKVKDSLKKTKKRKKGNSNSKAMLSFAMDDEESGEQVLPSTSTSNSNGANSSDDNTHPETTPTRGDDGDQDSDMPPPKRSKRSTTPTLKSRPKKNPTVDTSFLPDRLREDAERAERERLRLEWLAKQEEIKAEEIDVVYSYWDGGGRRRSVKCKKGDTISSFLEKCRAQFTELRGVSVDNLMYVKEDLIIPHHYTFYDFIINKSRGKSGPLFNFDVHDDVRLLADATKVGSHVFLTTDNGYVH
ncbi:XAP5, circadian clock regulator-domain-containing protein [Rhodocollybia butyracea]|uniref:XAP5, circadian clock regulator-domain-containing protein n=1 Tax=Rhodocollybia butyracea TaxID=206335 RepID=A0A9P5Q486_9AGAR|nr:XAP5, circadian clock regulator-domain-containing protein [Rhodocollybia butyracea]